MNDLENYGLILKYLRKELKLSIRAMSVKTGRSIGWISEIENGHGLARMRPHEFDRIVSMLGGNPYRKMFRTWVANHKNAERVNRTFDGAVLKHIRKKKGMSLKRAETATGLSSTYLSKLERGRRPVNAEMRTRLMLAYGYTPSSFKNLSTDPVRSKVVPLTYKLEILIQKLSPTQIDQVFELIQSLSTAEKEGA